MISNQSPTTKECFGEQCRGCKSFFECKEHFPQAAGVTRNNMHLIKSIIEKSRKLHGTIDFNGLQISIETGRSRVRGWHNPHDGSSGMSRMVLYCNGGRIN